MRMGHIGGSEGSTPFRRLRQFTPRVITPHQHHDGFPYIEIVLHLFFKDDTKLISRLHTHYLVIQKLFESFPESILQRNPFCCDPTAPIIKAIFIQILTPRPSLAPARTLCYVHAYHPLTSSEPAVPYFSLDLLRICLSERGTSEKGLLDQEQAT